ncbi:maleylpyruvate isomerase N-terminal domain-containing protein [Dactylosporangium sp. McL0621]|uniref:maleylpyruvate isomerase N-terminal domain-containing protein n=1 Tax=Dactylosporangium sp. McL0621 TaxID=3415678 RepID=UPI003CF6F16A
MDIEPLDAWAAETGRLVEELRGVPAGDWARPSPCPPWSAAGLLGHVVAGVTRVPGMPCCSPNSWSHACWRPGSTGSTSPPRSAGSRG